MGWDKSKTNPIEWCAKMKDAPREAVNIFAFSIFNRVVMRTPVDTGAARQNWLVSLNSEDQSVVRSGEKVIKKTYKSGKNKGQTIETRTQIWTTSNTDADLSNEKSRQVMSNGGKIIENAKGNDKIIIQNNLPYIKKLEYGGFTVKPETEKTIGGFSKQAPQGMVGLVLAKADDLWKRAVEAAKGL